ncbi:MAG: DNA-directed RNA polymerase subunit K [Desulfurococcales archaeon]|nr:DNA-directed RNA polymerase subunit K [Desulfurococcales archaeon]
MSGERYIAYPRVVEEITIGPPYLTKYERARIIGVRALQLSYGAPPLIPPEKYGLRDNIDIARFEVDNGILPVSVFRYTEAGVSQSIPLKLLIESEKKLRRAGISATG